MYNKPLILFDSIVGLNKDINEDGILHIQNSDYTLILLFDGVSNSNLPLSLISYCKEYIQSFHKDYISGNRIDFKGMMYDLNIKAVNDKIDGLTTYCGIYINHFKNICVVSNLGDSRIYMIKKKYISPEQLSVDHTLLPNENVLTKYLGGKFNKKDFFEKKVLIDNESVIGIILCSDGFYNLLNRNLEDYYNIMNYNKPGSIKKNISKLIQNNNIDDASYVYLIF